MRTSAVAATVIALGLLMSVGGCVVPNVPRPEIVAQGATALPAATVEDWVTYGDKAVVFRALAESRVAPPQVEIDRGEGLIGRVVDVRFDSVRWTRPSFIERVRLPTTMAVADGGWVFSGDEETPMRIEGQPKIEVGSSYLGILTYASLGAETVREPSWLILAHLPIANGVVERIALEGAPPVVEAIAGQTPDQVGLTLLATPPNPEASEWMAADPQVRFNRVAAKE